MNCDIITSEEDVDPCVKSQMSVYIGVKLCIDIEEKPGLFGACNASSSVP